MNPKSLPDRMTGGSKGYRGQPITRHHDAELGDFCHDPATNYWWTPGDRSTPGAYRVAGRSEYPTPRQKELLEQFRPLIAALARETLSLLEVPKGFTPADLPEQLEVREVRVEETGEVLLFFEPGLEIEGYDATPMATCSEHGALQSVSWTV